MNFGPDISTFLEALGQGYMTAEICEPKFTNGKDMAR